MPHRPAPPFAPSPTSSWFLPACFVLFALPVLLFLAVSVPTGEVPDEVAHIIRMNGLLHGSIVGHRVPRGDHAGNPLPDSGVTANAAMLAAGFSFTPGSPLAQRVMTRDRLSALQNLAWEDHTGFVSIPNTAVYAPLFYIPGAAAMGAAHVAGAGPWQAVIAARVANAVLYVLLGLAALLLARRAQGLLFAALLLPMSLWLGASCNQDGGVIATTVLAAALFSRGTARGWWAGALALAAVAVAKPLYLPLAGCAVLLLPARGLALPMRAAGAALVVAPALAWFAIAQHYAVVPFVRGEPFAAGPYWFGSPGQVFGAVDAGLQLQVLLHRPSLLFTLPVRTALADPYLGKGVVGILGVLDIILPDWLYGLWFTALGALCLGESLAARHAGAPGPLAAALMFACIAATVLALFDGQYLSWTYTGAALVQGVQGRYFIPLLPFVGLALPTLRTAAAPALRAAFRLPALAAAAAGLAVIPALVLTTYYLR